MNYGVHAIMYFYFYLRASGYKPSWDWIVTTLQISQMFVGMFVCGAVAVYQFVLRQPCNVQRDNLVAGGIMYASYAALFIFFALEKYITGKSSLAKSKTAVAPGDAAERFLEAFLRCAACATSERVNWHRH